MKFSLLLYMLFIVLKIYPVFKKSFRNKLQEQDCSLTISESETGISRIYRFKKGKVETLRGGDEKTDISLIWSDAAQGARYMMTPSPTVMTMALGKGHLSLKGDAVYFTWFLSLIKRLPL